MTVEQQYLLNELEKALAKLVHDGKNEEASKLGILIEYLQNEEPEIAYLEGQELGVDEKLLNAIKVFHKILY